MEARTEKRLRLRLRVVDGSQRGKVDVPAACTLHQLMAAVQQELRITGDDLAVSLDKKVSLQVQRGTGWPADRQLMRGVPMRLTCACQRKAQGRSAAAAQILLHDASARLTALGVCSGDMLWVHTQQSAVPMECTRPVSRRSAPAPSAHPAAASAGASHGSLTAHNTALQPPPRQACADAAEARSRAAVQVGCPESSFTASLQLLCMLLQSRAHVTSRLCTDQVGHRHDGDPVSSDAAELPQPGSRLPIAQHGSSIHQIAAVVHAVACDCGLEGMCAPEAQVRPVERRRRRNVCMHVNLSSWALSSQTTAADVDVLLHLCTGDAWLADMCTPLGQQHQPAVPPGRR